MITHYLGPSILVVPEPRRPRAGSILFETRLLPATAGNTLGHPGVGGGLWRQEPGDHNWQMGGESSLRVKRRWLETVCEAQRD